MKVEPLRTRIGLKVSWVAWTLEVWEEGQEALAFGLFRDGRCVAEDRAGHSASPTEAEMLRAILYLARDVLPEEGPEISFGPNKPIHREQKS